MEVLTKAAPVFVVRLKCFLSRCFEHPVEKVHVNSLIFQQKVVHVVLVRLNAISISVLFPSRKVYFIRVNSLPPVPFDRGDSYQRSWLEVWRKPSKAPEMFQSGSSLLAKDGVGPVLVLINLSWRHGHRRHEEKWDKRPGIGLCDRSFGSQICQGRSRQRS